MREESSINIKSYLRIMKRLKGLEVSLRLPTEDSINYKLTDSTGNEFYSSPELNKIDAFTQGLHYHEEKALKESEPTKRKRQEVRVYHFPISKIWYFIPIEDVNKFDSEHDMEALRIKWFDFATIDPFDHPKSFENCDILVYFDKEKVYVLFDNYVNIWYFLPPKIYHKFDDMKTIDTFVLLKSDYSEYSTKDFFIYPKKYEGRTMKTFMEEIEREGL